MPWCKADFIDSFGIDNVDNEDCGHHQNDVGEKISIERTLEIVGWAVLVYSIQKWIVFGAGTCLHSALESTNLIRRSWRRQEQQARFQ